MIGHRATLYLALEEKGERSAPFQFFTARNLGLK